MKGTYWIAAGLALAGVAVVYFLKKRTPESASQPENENERHHLTTAFARAKQSALGK